MANYCSVHLVEHYLPLRKVQRIYQRRRVTFLIPLFTGYVFTAFNRSQRPLVLKSNFVARILDVCDQERFLYELDQIRKALAIDPTLGPCPALTKGKLVRIVSGAFKGIEGIVQALKPNAKVVLNVEIIGQAAAVEVEAGNMEIIE